MYFGQAVPVSGIAYYTTTPPTCIRDRHWYRNHACRHHIIYSSLEGRGGGLVPLVCDVQLITYTACSLGLSATSQ
jgi:hypothetical protein